MQLIGFMVGKSACGVYSQLEEKVCFKKKLFTICIRSSTIRRENPSDTPPIHFTALWWIICY